MSENSPENIIKGVPLIALRGVTAFPNTFIRFDAVRDMTIEAIEEAAKKDNMVFLVAQKDMNDEEIAKSSLYKIGVYAKLKQIVKLPGEELRVLAEGVCAAHLDKFSSGNYLKADINLYSYSDELSDVLMQSALMESLKKAYQTYFELSGQMSRDFLYHVHTAQTLADVCYHILSGSNFTYILKQEFLEMLSIEPMAQKLLTKLSTDIEVLRLEKDIESKVKDNIDEGQKQYYLREQLKAIQEELGESAHKENKEYLEYAQKIKQIKADKDVIDKLLDEAEKLAQVPPLSPESGLLKNYLDTVLHLPWNKLTKEQLNLTRAENILNRDHYGLLKVKERILEYLAVRKRTAKLPPPILCLVGPPGVGKTSIVQSIAQAVNRKYVRISLGGVKDEAEIRGHRKTYIGAMPGRIMEGMITAKTKNPLLLLDEIDKLSSDYKGDPTSAMLEVLDAEQNFAFCDHYIEVPFDLSKVMFVTTANDRANIPAPLMDRMEIIELDGYTREEKYHIAYEHLWNKQLKKHGLTNQVIKIDKDAMYRVIDYYTYEAGVRVLERTLAKVMRKAAKILNDGALECVTITKDNLSDFLGKEKFDFDLVHEKDEVGIARGLAWTQAGGDTLNIEVNIMDGTGKIELTGQLGDVMKESANIAISYVRSRAKDLKIQADFYKTKDIHIHVPEGAVPKDGPSAGITMATAIISALTGFRVKRYVAMTGEITLRGRVLPIGGLKEKSMAAYRAGVKTILFPQKNEKDLDEVSEEIKKSIHFIPVSSMEDVLLHALTFKEKKPQTSFLMQQLSHE